MRELYKYYAITMLLLCFAVLGTAAFITAGETNSAMAFGTNVPKIELGNTSFVTELKNFFTWMFSFLPFRE